MTTEAGAEQACRQEERELSIISQSAQTLAELVERIGSHFRRAEVRKRVRGNATNRVIWGRVAVI